MYEHFYLDDYNISRFSEKTLQDILQRLLRLSKLDDAILFRWISPAHFVSLIFNMTLDSLSQPGKSARSEKFVFAEIYNYHVWKMMQVGRSDVWSPAWSERDARGPFLGWNRETFPIFMEPCIIQQPLLSSASNPRARWKLFPLNDKQGKV